MRFKQVMAALMEALEGQKLKRAEFIKTQLENKWKPIPGAATLEEFIELIGEADPSRNGMYMPWLAKVVFADPVLNKIEDLERTKGDLEMFERLKPRLAKKDINQYRSFNELFDAIEPLLATARKEQQDKEEENKELAALKGQLKIVYRGPEGWIMVPLTEQASCYLGQNTRWCTAATISSNMFKSYDRSDFLFVIYNKEKKTRRQLHLVDDQYMDEQDRPAPKSEIPDWARKAIAKFYQKYVASLNWSQARAADAFLGTDLLSQGKFDEITSLMKEFGL